MKSTLFDCYDGAALKLGEASADKIVSDVAGVTDLDRVPAASMAAVMRALRAAMVDEPADPALDKKRAASRAFYRKNKNQIVERRKARQRKSQPKTIARRTACNGRRAEM